MMNTRRRGAWRLTAACLAVAGAAACLTGAASAAGVFFVSPTGSDANPCTAQSPCRTIGRALTAAGPSGGLILVAPGTYAESVAITSRVLLLGNQSVIDATGNVNGISVAGPGASGTSIQGFTVENANAEGIVATGTSHLMIKGNTVERNDKLAGNPTGPVQCHDNGPIPGDCGEGIHLNGVTDSTVVNNEVTQNIGGILLTDEAGPTARNTIVANNSHDNAEDCGITLASHNPAAAGNPAVGGVYDNSVIGNSSRNNGAGGGGAGVGTFAGPPGAASYDNRVIGNTLIGNSEAGAAVHSHAPGQNVSGNQFIGNVISDNGHDPDAGANQPTGISVWSAVVPSSVTLIGNTITNEYYGIFVGTNMTVNGLITNSTGNVTKPIGP